MTTIPRSFRYSYSFRRTINDSRTGISYYSESNPVYVYDSSGGVTGQANPGWRDKIAKRSDASSAYSITGIESWEPASFSCSTKTLPTGPTAGYIIESDSKTVIIGSGISLPSSSSQALSDRALAKLKNQLRSQSGQFQALAPLAESGELKQTIASSIHLTNQFLQSLVSAKRKWSLKGFRRFASEAWLTYNFGIAPTIRDTQALGLAIAKYLARQDLSLRLHSSASDRGLASGVCIDNPPVAFGAGVKGTYAVDWTLRYVYTGAFDIFLKSSNNYSVFDSLGLGLEQIPGAAWEVLGLSWIVDYFSNVGEFLDDTFVSPSGNTRYLVVSRLYKAKVETQWQTFVTPSNPNNVVGLNLGFGIGGFEYFSFSRTPLTTLPHIALRVRSFDEIGKYGLSKLFNLTSLLR